MEHLCWFGINKKQCALKMSSVDPEVAIHYLKEKTFKIKYIEITKEDKFELIQKKEDEEWRQGDFNEISYLYELFDTKSVISFETILNDGGCVNFMYGTLVVHFKKIDELKKITLKILEFYGYFASKKIWNFCCKKNHEFLISIVLGKKNHEINDGFEKMSQHNENLKNEEKEFEKEFNAKNNQN